MEANEILASTIQQIDGAYAPSSIRAYKANFEKYIAFCESISEFALPSDADTVAIYIQNLSTRNLKSASIRLAVASIYSINKLNQLPDPTKQPKARLELRRMHRTLGRGSKQALGITASILEKMLLVTNEDLRGLRDKALLLLAYDSLCRRSELVSLRIGDIKYNSQDLPTHIRLRKSKTDQEATGRSLKLQIKCQIAIKHWIDKARLKDGMIIRGVKNNDEITDAISLGQINKIYKQLAFKAGMNYKDISGHSIRVGAAQDLAMAGSSLPILMNSGGWTKPETAMRYIEGLSST